MKKFLTYHNRHGKLQFPASDVMVSQSNHGGVASRTSLRQAPHDRVQNGCHGELVEPWRGGPSAPSFDKLRMTPTSVISPSKSRRDFKTQHATPFLKIASLLLVVIMFLSACGGADKPADEAEAEVKSQTPVTITTIDENPMADYVEMNATAVFQQKNYVKANANGYIQLANAKPGQFVNKGALLFTIKTKEAQSIGNSINILDTTFKFSGVNKIKASEHGFISQLSHQAGDYVADGEQLAVISDESSFAFILQVPYELRALVKPGQDVPLTLPDGEKLTGKVASIMPSVDTLSQTQGVVVKVNSSHPIPENLVARARLIKTAKQSTVSLPKSAVLSNETQTDFWVMKLLNDTLAVKVPVTKGIQTTDRIEILSPKFTAQDRIVVTGNYGLSDTAKVKIVKQP